MKYTVGIDFGSLSARATLVETASGRELAGAECKYSHGVMSEADISGEAARDTTALQHPLDYIEALGTVREVIRISGVSPSEIGAIAIDFTAANVLPILSDGTPLCTLEKFESEPHAYVKMWKHHGASEEAKRMTEIANEHFPAISEPYCGIISSEWTFPKIYETLNSAPEVYRVAERFIEAADWITLILTGSDTRSACCAGYKALWSRERGYPSRDFFRAVDPRLEHVISEKMAGEIRELCEVAGYVNEYGADLTGLAVGTKVSCAIIDSKAALPAVGAVNNGDLVISMGTSACHILISDKDVPVSGIGGKVRGGVASDLVAYTAGQSAVGDIFAWIGKTCVPAAYEAEAESRGISPIALLSEKAAAMDVGESGLIALDWWNGNRSPYADYELSGMILGLTLRTPPEAIFRAAVEAVIFGTKRIIEKYESLGLNVDRIIVGGGIPKKNPFIMQALSDALGRDIYAAQISQSGAHGSAIYAAVTAGAYPTLAAAAEQMASRDTLLYSPRAELTEKYDRLYGEYLKLAEYFYKENLVMKRLKSK